MSFLKNFTIPTPKTISAVGGIVVGDTTSQCALFIARFGEKWKLIPELKNVYVMFDKLDKVCFTLRGDEIAIYPNVTRDEFINSMKGNRELITESAVYRTLDPKYKYHYLQILQMLKDFDVE